MPKNDAHVTVKADDRERKGEVINYLLDMKNVTVDVTRLSIGDYLADNRLIFERKTLNDFALSIIDGRLFTQAIRLTASNHRGILILEGTGKDLQEIGVRREAMQGALITVSLILGIPVLRSINPSETANLIIYTARQIKSVAKGTLYRHGYQPKDKRKRQIFVLQGLPGIGAERAKRLLDTFGSIEAVITAGSEELQSVDGIGKNIAERIKWTVSEQAKPYGSSDEWLI